MDSEAAMFFSKSDRGLTRRLKHVSVKHCSAQGAVSTDENTADGFTKPLDSSKLMNFCVSLGMVEIGVVV